MLGVLAAAGAALRVLSAGTAGLEPMFFLLVIAGRVLGATQGVPARRPRDAGVGVPDRGRRPVDPVPDDRLRLGRASAPALLPRASGTAERWLLAGVRPGRPGCAYGAVMNLWFWPFLGDAAPAGAGYVPDAGAAVNLGHYAVFYVTTSLAWDLPRGLLTAAPHLRGQQAAAARPAPQRASGPLRGAPTLRAPRDDPHARDSAASAAARAGTPSPCSPASAR